MSSTSEPALFIIDIGAPEWCWSHLGAGGEGIMSYEASRGRASLAVPYAVTGRHITIPLASWNAAGWRAAGTETRLEVIGLSSEGMRWVVRATGTAERADPSRRAYSRRMHPANPRGAKTTESSEQLVMLNPRVRGFYETGLPA